MEIQNCEKCGCDVRDLNKACPNCGHVDNAIAKVVAGLMVISVFGYLAYVFLVDVSNW